MTRMATRVVVAVALGLAATLAAASAGAQGTGASSVEEQIKKMERDRAAAVDDREKALAAGFQAYLAKPAEPEELVTVLSGLAGRRAAGAEGPD